MQKLSLFKNKINELDDERKTQMKPDLTPLFQFSAVASFANESCRGPFLDAFLPIRRNPHEIKRV